MVDPLEFGDEGDEPSVLNETDRAYLRGDLELAGQRERDRRQRIRDRVRRAISDFGLLFSELDAHDRELIFRRIVDPERYREHAGSTTSSDVPERILTGIHLYRQLGAMIAFLYSGCRDFGVSFERLVEIALLHAEEMWITGPLGIKDVTVDISVEYLEAVDFEMTLRKLRSGGKLTDGEYRYLVTQYFKDPDRFIEEVGGLELGLEEALDSDEALTRGEALVLIARAHKEPYLIASDDLLDRLPDEVISHFGLDALVG